VSVITIRLPDGSICELAPYRESCFCELEARLAAGTVEFRDNVVTVLDPVRDAEVQAAHAREHEARR